MFKYLWTINCTLKKKYRVLVALFGQRKKGGKRERPVMDQQIKWENRFSTKERNLLYLERADYPIWRVIKPVTAVQKGGSNSVWISFSFRIESNRTKAQIEPCPRRGLIFVRYVDVVRWCALFILPLAPALFVTPSKRFARPDSITLEAPLWKQRALN